MPCWGKLWLFPGHRLHYQHLIALLNIFPPLLSRIVPMAGNLLPLGLVVLDFFHCTALRGVVQCVKISNSLFSAGWDWSALNILWTQKSGGNEFPGLCPCSVARGVAMPPGLSLAAFLYMSRSFLLALLSWQCGHSKGGAVIFCSQPLLEKVQWSMLTSLKMLVLATYSCLESKWGGEQKPKSILKNQGALACAGNEVTRLVSSEMLPFPSLRSKSQCSCWSFLHPILHYTELICPAQESS